MAKLGTIEVYQSLAEILNDDATWQDIGKGLDYSMIHAYAEPIGKSFFLRFSQGKVDDVREVTDVAQEKADFVLTSKPEVWRRVFSKVPKTRASGFHLALSTSQIRFTGPFMSAYRCRAETAGLVGQQKSQAPPGSTQSKAVVYDHLAKHGAARQPIDRWPKGTVQTISRFPHGCLRCNQNHRPRTGAPPSRRNPS